MRFSLSSISILLLCVGFAAADTLKVLLFTNACSTLSQEFTVGNLNECHNADPFDSVEMSDIAQSFFNRDLRVIFYSEPNCQGTRLDTELTNAHFCRDTQGTPLANTKLASFMVGLQPF
ncbi:hypothetical protein B7463_g2200, partial [Scytalidium lignicola]